MPITLFGRAAAGVRRRRRSEAETAPAPTPHPALRVLTLNVAHARRQAQHQQRRIERPPGRHGRVVPARLLRPVREPIVHEPRAERAVAARRIRHHHGHPLEYAGPRSGPGARGAKARQPGVAPAIKVEKN